MTLDEGLKVTHLVATHPRVGLKLLKAAYKICKQYNVCRLWSYIRPNNDSVNAIISRVIKTEKLQENMIFEKADPMVKVVFLNARPR